MNIILGLIKIFICIFFCIGIIRMARNQDTSNFQKLALNSKLSLSKFFSVKQLSNIEISFKKLNIPYNTTSIGMILIIGAVIFVVSFIICNKIFNMLVISVIVSFPMFFSPFWTINFIASREQNKLEQELNDFFIQLKCALNINSDIIEALRRIQNDVLEPFSTYVKQLLREINTGKLPDKALENFAQKVNIKKFSLYINNVKYCHMYGGDINELTNKTQKIISDSIKQKRKRERETKAICVVLYMLIAIDLYMYFYFCAGNQFYLEVLTNSFFGKCILAINFLSLWGVVGLSKFVKKMDY